MADWIKIRVKTEPAKMRYVRAQIRGYPEFAMRKYYFQLLQQIVSIGVDAGRWYMRTDRSNWTPTGLERAARGGGYKGRSETDRMASSFKQDRGRKDGGKYKINYGWLDGDPGYAIFQEQGFSTTKGFVKGMHAIEYVTDLIRQELRLLDTPAKAYRATRNAQWRFNDGGTG